MSHPYGHPTYAYGLYPAHPYYPSPSHSGFATPPHHPAPPHYGFYPGPAPVPAPAPATSDLAAEEAAALAHLQAIQARRRAQEAATVDRTTPLNFGDFIARAIAEERKREKEQRAKEHAKREAQRAKEAAEAEARKVREVAEVKARQAREAAARQAEIAAREAAAAREQAHECARRARANAIAEARQAKWNAVMAARQRYAQQQIAARQEWLRSRSPQAEQVRQHLAENEYAQRAARYARQAAKPHVEKYAGHIGQLNEVLGSLFGINIVQDEEKEKEKVEEKEEKHLEFKGPVIEAPAPASAPAAAATTTEEKKGAPAPADAKEAQFPDSINDILGSFLGLRVEPTTKDTAAPSAPADLSDLNKLLGQFGLVFEHDSPEAPAAPTAGPSTAPTKVSEPTTEASSSNTAPKAAAQEETPLTSFLNGVTDLPPFVRDILGNLELAWKEEATPATTETNGKKDKGKGVAPGEKPTRPAPVSPPSPAETDSSTTSLSQLSSIATELALVRDSFTFPDRLAFAPSTTDTAPALLFNKTNSGYHAQANKLLQLLLAADGVSSGGDREVRARRKEVVRAVEAEITQLEKKRDAAWDEVKARREASGEVSEDEEGLSTGSAAPSVIDHEEVRDVNGDGEVVFHYDEPEAEHVEHNADVEKVEGFEVPVPEVVEEAATAPEVIAAPPAESSPKRSRKKRMKSTGRMESQ